MRPVVVCGGVQGTGAQMRRADTQPGKKCPGWAGGGFHTLLTPSVAVWPLLLLPRTQIKPILGQAEAGSMVDK